MTLPIEREAILPRVDGMRKNLQRLQKLAELPFDDFSSGDSYDLAQHHLRLALEGVFHISSHILSRVPGGRAVEYKEIAEKMGECHLLDSEFVKQSLVPMAGMRNILVHHYADIDPKNLYQIVQNNLADIERFLHDIKEILVNPQKFGLTVE